MDLFNKITISNLIWYIVPGLGMIFFVLFPILALNPHIVKLFYEQIGEIGLLILGTILGFLFEGLRLYRFRPGYSTIKKGFFDELTKTIGTDLNPYFVQSHVDDFARTKNYVGLSLHHAIWIMLGQFTILFLFEALFWGIMAIYNYYYITQYYSLFGLNISRIEYITYCGAFSVTFLSIGLRLMVTSTQDQKNTNNMFLNFAKQYRHDLQKLLNMEVD
ncbi:MAG: hypothetical protein FP814_02515 [Desulfobacterium sp.]|nr:hypothetical protein [Desulfobacteraceae bacterium]MBA3035346.1 hypothetical protein [Desulfobacterium sp.]MBU3948953.1 hypothetical protein [Pseudomonadota bacterium]MBU4035522.1 hypothetical protein [Pseudomonadota bacterium]